MATGYSQIPATSTGTNLLTQLLGQRTGTTGSTEQLLSNLTSGVSSGSSTTSNTADLDALQQVFQQASQGMTPEMLQSLITSIFTEGAAAVPALTAQYANSTGSRVSGNSGLNLALGDLNKNLSTQAVQALLNYNQGQQQTAANAANAIAGATRQTTQQQQANQTQQQQQSSNSTSRQIQQQTVNPYASLLVGAGGSALNWLDKKGAFDKLFGRNSGATGSTGITSAAPTFGGATGTVPGAGSLSLGSPATSSGLLALPASSGGGGFGAMGGFGATPTDFSGMFQPTAGISSGGGITDWAGSPLLSFGSGGGADAASNFFGNWGTGQLFDGSGIGQTAFDVGSGIGGITDWANTANTAAATLGGSSASNWFGDAYDGISDFFSSFFADGGPVSGRGIGAPGDTRYSGAAQRQGPFQTPAVGAAMPLARELAAGLYGAPEVMQQGTLVRVPAGTPTGPAVTPDAVMQLLPFLLRSAVGMPNPAGYADGGQVSTGAAPARVRNQNFMGARQERDRSDALNYEGYGAPNAAVGSSSPAGVVPGGAVSASALSAAPMAAGSQVQMITPELYQQMVAQSQLEQGNAAVRSFGGGGASGEGAGMAGANESTAGVGISGPAMSAAQAMAALSSLPGINAITGLASAQNNEQAIGKFITALISMTNPAAAAAMGLYNIASSLGITPGFGGGGGNGGGQGSSVGENGFGVSSVSVGEATADDGTTTAGAPTGTTSEGFSTATGETTSAGGTGGVGGGEGSAGAGTSAGDAGAGPGEGGGVGGGNWADGGLVRGPGTGTSDSISVTSREPGGREINYSNNEYVIPEDVVKVLGTQYFDNLLAQFHTPTTVQ